MDPDPDPVCPERLDPDPDPQPCTHQVQGFYFKASTFSAHTGNLKYIFEIFFLVLADRQTYLAIFQ